MTVFNALESLLDSTETSDQNNPNAIKGTGSALLGSDEDLIVEEIELSEESFINEPFIEDEEESISETVDEESLETDDDELDEIDSEISSTEEDPTEIYKENEIISEDDIELEEDEVDDEPVFGELIEDDLVEISEIPEPPKQSSWMWAVTSVLMFGLLAFQFIKFNTETVLEKFPQLQVVCGYIDCPVEEEIKDTSAINLVSRDVREHPQFKNVLLVNATLMSNAESRQPFPKLQLDLYDKVGRSIGGRQFAPNEYLDSSVDLEVGMKPELPVHIVLEVIGSAEEASSFEFTFL